MKTKLNKVITAVLCAALTVSCTSADRSKVFGYGDDFKIEMYSGGQLVRTWISNGKVLSESQSDGYYFTDKETGKLIEVCGDIVITKL